MEKHFEVCGVKWIVGGNFSVVLIVCYRSPTDGSVSVFCDQLQKVLEFIYKPYVPIIVVGDFNLDPNRDSRSYKMVSDVFLTFGLENVVSENTRGNYTLDHIYVNCTQHIEYGVVNNVISDHKTLLINSNIVHRSKNKQFVYKRTFPSESMYRFFKDLDQESWEAVYGEADFSEAFEVFYNIFLYYFNVHFPVLRKNTGSSTKRWVDDAVRKSGTELRDLFVLSEAFPELKQCYNNAKQVHTRLLMNTKKQFYQRGIFNSDNLTKSAWNVVKLLSNQHQTHKNLVLKVEGCFINDPQIIAESFNRFFIEAPLNVIKQLPAATGGVGNIRHYHSNNMFLFPYSSSELYRLIQTKLKNKTSSGPDDIPNFLIKRAVVHFLEPLTYLVNMSFGNGCFPDKIKLTEVHPLYKKNDPYSMENYRPVAQLSVFSKILEYCFLDRLNSFLNKNNILTDNQFGFRGNRSTIKAVHTFYDKAVASMERGECPAGIFCDLSRAFDCVSHERLLAKLEAYGIRGNAYSWISSFLRGRQQVVTIKHCVNNHFRNSQSTRLPVNMGVPQGSVLGPVLFLLYINDMDVHISDNVAPTLYADDTSLLISGASGLEIRDKCARVLSDLGDWFVSNSLYLNIDKTNVVRFHNYQYTGDLSIDIQVNGSSVRQVNSCKFLGLHVDEHLKWKLHCADIVSKLNSVCFQLRSLREVLTSEQLVSLYHAQVSSRLRYGVVLWGLSTAVSDVFISQKRIVRALANVPGRHSCRPLFKAFKILTVASLYIYEVCVFIFLNKTRFVRNNHLHNHDTRTGTSYHIPFRSLTIGVNSPDCMGLKIFNALPQVIAECVLLNNFRLKLRSFLVHHAFYSVDDYFKFINTQNQGV